MKELLITLPNKYPAKLLFVIDYTTARENGSAIAWLQQRKLAGKEVEKAYQNELPKFVSEFAKMVDAKLECSPDVVLVPASESRFFEPYLNKLKELKPEMVVIEGLFKKAKGFQAGVNGQTYQQVLNGITLTGHIPNELARADSIMIIDDIYNTGNTAGAMLTRVLQDMKANLQVTIVCVIYVPLEKKSDEFEWETAMQKVLAAKDAVTEAE